MIWIPPDDFGHGTHVAGMAVGGTGLTVGFGCGGADILKVHELLGHRHVTTTQIYDKRRRAASEGASHDMPS